MSETHCDPTKQIVFASNDVTIAVDTVVRGSLIIPGEQLPGKVILLASDAKIDLHIALDDIRLPPPVATFDISQGLRGIIIPDQKAWVIHGIPSFVPQRSGNSDAGNVLVLDTNVRLSFKSLASFWAFAFFLSGVNGPLPRSSRTGMNYALTFDKEQLRNVMSSKEVFEFPA